MKESELHHINVIVRIRPVIPEEVAEDVHARQTCIKTLKVIYNHIL